VPGGAGTKKAHPKRTRHKGGAPTRPHVDTLESFFHGPNGAPGKKLWRQEHSQVNFPGTYHRGTKNLQRRRKQKGNTFPKVTTEKKARHRTRPDTNRDPVRNKLPRGGDYTVPKREHRRVRANKKSDQTRPPDNTQKASDKLVQDTGKAYPLVLPTNVTTTQQNGESLPNTTAT